MSSPRLRSYTFPLQANEETHRSIGGNFINVRSATSMFQIKLDGGAVLDMDTNRSFHLEEADAFSGFSIIDTSGAPNTIQLEVGFGNIRVNDVAITGTVKTDDDQTQTALASLETAVDAVETAVNALATLTQNDEDQRVGLTTLEGASYAEQTAAGTNNVVTAGANANGVIIRLAGAHATPNGSNARIEVNSNSILNTGTTSGGSAFAAPNPLIKDIFVPNGVAVDLVVSGINAQAWIWYEVL